MKTPHGRVEIEKLFGNPASSNGKLNEAWEEENIRLVKPPKGWKLYYQDSGKLKEVSGIRLHKLLEKSFHAVMTDIWDQVSASLGGQASDEKIREEMHKLRIDQHGGGFNFRKIAGSKNLSLHSYGCSIDWDPDHNPHKKPLTHSLPEWWYQIWHKHGWSDGRGWKTPDPMHVQFATGA